MEKSIKRVEKLVHATNSALAQMKFSLMFDDLGGEESGKLRALKAADPSLLDRILDGDDDLKHCQDEFKAEASQMLAKVETMAASKEIARKNSKAVDRIKEINARMNGLRLEHSKQGETERSRQKLLNLINEEKFSPGVSSGWDSARTSQEKKPSQKPPPTPKRTESLLALAKSPGKSTDELKSKILETQEIVDRGFQTARQLAQKVETMSKKEKTPTAEKTVSEINVRSLESNESPHSVKCRRKRREERESVEIPRVNARVIDVKSEEVGRCRRVNLQMQRLPSLNIRGGLRLQKVHSLEIPAGGDGSCTKSNTAVSFLTHDQLENEKMGEMIEKVRKENCCCSGNKPRGSYVECFNCGKLIRIRDTAVDPRKVDEILQQCNFNVFDPRIDEFVEKCGTATTASESRKKPPVATHPPEEAPAPPLAPRPRPETPAKEAELKKKEEQLPKVRRRCSTLRSFSDQVLSKYKKEAETLESNHLKLDSILQNLFRQVDESREVFQKCHLLEGRREHGPGPKLTPTKPVLVSLTGTPVRGRKRSRKLELKKKVPGKGREGEPREATEVEKERGKTTLICVSPVKLDKEEALRVVTPSSSGHTISGKLSEAGKPEEGASSVKSSSTSRSRSSKHSSGKENIEETLLPPRLLGKGETQRKYFGTNKKKNVETAESKKEKVEEKAPPETLSSSGSKSRRSDGGNPSEQLIWKALLKKDETERKTLALASGKSEGKPESDSSSENNYESDFESVTNEPNENLDECEEEEAEAQAAVNKLSTISEVDSELERRLSDEAKTIRSNLKMDTEDEFETKGEADAKDYKKREEEGKEENEKKEKGGNSAEASIKSTPTELVTSLKDILSALQDQFVRTESLAEKLTENVRSEEAGKPPSGMPLLGEAALSSWKKPMGAALVENLRSARKDSSGGGGGSSSSKSPRRSARSTRAAEEKGFSADSLSDEGGSSLGEIVVSDRKRKTSEKSGSSSISECSFLKLDSVRRSARVASDRREANAASPFKLEIYDEEVLYSEGEIPNDQLLPSERLRTTSVGEVISGKNSTASTVE